MSTPQWWRALCHIGEEDLRTSNTATGCRRPWQIAPSESLRASKTASVATERHGFAWRDASPSYLYGETLLTEPDVMAILLPHSICKLPLQPESTAAKRCSSSIGRVELRREAAAGDCSSSRHPAAPKQCAMSMACAHHARRWRMCDVTVALAAGAVHRAWSTPSHENRRSELHRPRPKAKNATDIARQSNGSYNRGIEHGLN